MKKQIYLLVLLFWIGASAMAQNAAGGKPFANPILNEISALKDLGDQIVKAETAAASTSRANAASAQEKITALYASYTKELENQQRIHAKDAKIVSALNEELNLVNTKK